MTIRSKAEKEGIEIDRLKALADAAGIDTADIDRELDKSDTMRLANVAKGQTESTAGAKESGTVRFWSTTKNHTIGNGIVDLASVKIENHVLLLNAESDAALIGRIRKLRKTDIFEISDVPFSEESNDYFDFDQLLSGLMFSGQHGETSKSGVKTVRMLFDNEELLSMGGNAFDPQRLKARALRYKSYVRLINNGIN